ncbi:MAG: MFS transporter [Pirellulales bacterium]|nr:MFS transporter [Pirellulales bacterium]
MSMNNSHPATESQTLLGHPAGLFTLFFAEMWERFSYYGMRALLVFYMIKGFLGYNDDQAYGVYGAYTALVYATPFIGGVLADRLLGARRAVVLGGLLMAAGQLFLTVENEVVFYIALALLICGNGFFKPNISTIVGSLYPKGSAKKDTGFTIFYMGINLGAALSPVICGYVGETWGWHYGFGLAAAGMLIGVAIFAAPTLLTQVLILGGALAAAVCMPFLQDSMLQLVTRLFLSVSLLVSGIIAFLALGRGGIPETAGIEPSKERLSKPAFPELRNNTTTYYLALIAVIFALSLIASPSSSQAWMLACAAIGAILIPWVSSRNAVYVCVATSIPVLALLVQRNEIALCLLTGFGILAFSSLTREAIRSKKIERERMYVVLILMFFSFLFWAFFEQAGSSLNNFTDRNIDRVLEDESLRISEDQIGSSIIFRIPLQSDDEEIMKLPLLSQEQLGMPCDDELIARVERAIARQKLEKEREKKEKIAQEDWGPHLVELVEKILDEKDDREAKEDEVTVSIAVSSSYVLENRGDHLVYTFTRNGPIAEPLRVSFEVAGTAKYLEEKRDKKKKGEKSHEEKGKQSDFSQKGADYFTTSSGIITIPADQLSAELTITPTPDITMEEDETIILTVISGAGYVSGDSNEAKGTIENDDKFFTMTHLTILRDEAKREDAIPEDKKITWAITKEHVGMGIGGAEIPASEYQAANPIYILIFGLVFSALWSIMSKYHWEPSTPFKFALGLLQLGLAFGVYWYGAYLADDRGMVAMVWLLLGYFLQTTGELCLSPVGLAMVTKLSPTRIVSTVMGAWFLATAFSNGIAGVIAMFTGVQQEGEGQQIIPPPSDTLHLYSNVFFWIALTSIVSALICFLIAPLLSRWMHEEAYEDEIAESDPEAAVEV